MFESAGVYARLDFFPKDISVAQKIQNEGAKEAVAELKPSQKPSFCGSWNRFLPSIKPSLPMWPLLKEGSGHRLSTEGRPTQPIQCRCWGSKERCFARPATARRSRGTIAWCDVCDYRFQRFRCERQKKSFSKDMRTFIIHRNIA